MACNVLFHTLLCNLKKPKNIKKLIDLGKIDFNKSKNFKLYIKLFDQKVGFQIFDTVEKFKSSNEVEINLSKIFYFFTSNLPNDNQNLKNFFKNEEVDFRIVIDDDWNNPLAQCQTMCLSFFDPDSDTLRVKNTLNFFSSEMKHFKCQVYIGLKNDNQIVSKDMNFYNYDPQSLIYLTNKNYFAYHALPSDWYELFLPQDYHIEEEDNDYDLDLIINRFINEIEFNDKKKANIKEETQNEIFDPYDTLIKIENKKDIITKIRSIPMILDKDLFNKKIEDKKLRPSASGLMRKLNNDAFPVINNTKIGFKKDSENTSNISDKLFDKKHKEINDTRKYSKNNDMESIEDNLIRYKTSNKKTDSKYLNRNKFPKENKKKDLINVSSSSETLGSDFKKINEDKKQKIHKDNIKNTKMQITELEEKDKKVDELDGMNFDRINNILNRMDDRLNELID